MSTVESPVVLPAEKTFLGMTPSTWMKLLGLLVVLIVVFSILGAFKGFSHSAAMNNLSDAFGNTTAALAWATSHWYLFLAGFMVAPFLPAALKWAADKASAIEKTKADATTKSKATDAVIYKQALERSVDQSLTPESRKTAAENAAKAEARFNEQSEEQKEKTDQVLEEVDVPHPAKAKITFLAQRMQQFLTENPFPGHTGADPVTCRVVSD